jgi:hypothetical protein
MHSLAPFQCPSADYSQSHSDNYGNFHYMVAFVAFVVLEVSIILSVFLGFTLSSLFYRSCVTLVNLNPVIKNLWVSSGK